jgi:RNA polymerase sigma-70 factor (ECF subfamily)
LGRWDLSRFFEVAVTVDPDTHESLLLRVKNPRDHDAWEQFSQIYRPVVYRLARGRGLQDADAQDLAQKVLMAVSLAIPDWEKSDCGGRFRHWLRRVAKNAVLNALSRQPRDRAGGGTTAIELLCRHEDPIHDVEEAIDLEFRRQLFRRAASIVSQRASQTNWKAFCLTMINGQSIEAAAQELGVSAGTVYAARSRIMRRLRETVEELEDE